jgi:hypothetical protein
MGERRRARGDDSRRGARLRRSGLPTAAAATLGTLLVLGLGYRTGQAGGSLVYQHGAAQAYFGATGSAGAEERPDHAD